MQRTFVMVKPDGVQRALVGEVIRRLERRGLVLRGLKMMTISRALAEEHYGVHRGKPFFSGLIDFITSGPVVAMVWEGREAINVVRTLMGVTDPARAAPGTIRGDLAMDIAYNVVHGSDGPETAEREIGLFFGPDELVEWSRDYDRWFYEDR